MSYSITKFGFKSSEQIDFDTFQDAVAETIDMSNGTAWALGDLMILGDSRWHEQYTQAFDDTKKSLATLRNYQTVAKSFPEQRREYDLSFSHYRAVCSLRNDEGQPLEHIQDELLRKAEAQQWNREDIRDAVKQAKGQTIEKKTIESQVGIVDAMLQTDYGLELGTRVRVTFEIVVTESERESEELAA
jgi:hypothetical protein